jgi:hypothetical protein
LLTALVPIVCIGLISLSVVRAHLTRELDHNGVVFARSMVNHITTYLQEPIGTFNLLTRHLASQQHSAREKSHLVTLLTTSYEYFDAIYLLDTNGLVQQAGFKEGHHQEEADFLGMDFSQVEICRQALQNKRLFWAPSVSMSSGEPTMSFCAPLAGGTVLADLKLTDLGRIINESSSGGVFTAFVVDRSGRIIAHPDRLIVRQKENVSNIPLIKSGLAGRTSSGFWL